MYAIYGNIYHQYTPNVSIYIDIPYMDPMGNAQTTSCQWEFQDPKMEVLYHFFGDILWGYS